MIDRIIKLKNLINNAKKLEVLFWLSKIETEKSTFVLRSEDKVIPLENVINIYSVREQINRSKGNPIKGFELFLERLNSTAVKFICIHQMKDQNGDNYLIFTDPDINELVGILKLVKKEPSD